MSHPAHSCCIPSANAAPGAAASAHRPASDQGVKAVEVRPGVLFPDWSVVGSAAAARAVEGIVNVADKPAKLTGIGQTEDVVWRSVLELYADLGRAPTAAHIAGATGLSAQTVARVLRGLHARDLVVLDAGGAIVGAYPFTERRTGHAVHLDGRTLTAMCAIDALGAGAMYRRDVRIESACLQCGRLIEIATRNEGADLAEVAPSGAVVWSGLQYANGCAATSLCTVLAFFCSDEHLSAWRAAAGRGADGLRLSMDEALQVGKAIFVPRLQVAAPDAKVADGTNECGVTVRRGVVFPGWSAITSENAANAVKAMFDVAKMGTKLLGISETEDVVWRAALELYARLGHAPAPRQVADATALSTDVVADTLRRLHARDLAVLNAEGSLTGVYPFTENRTEHLVHLGDHTLTAVCAIDALGAGAMYRQDARIESACRHCGRKIEVATRDEGAALATVSPPSAVVWSGIHYADECAANSLCTVLAFFCSDEHLEAWRGGLGRAVPGFRLSMGEGLQVGKAMFVPRLQSAEPAAVGTAL